MKAQTLLREAIHDLCSPVTQEANEPKTIDNVRFLSCRLQYNSEDASRGRLS